MKTILSLSQLPGTVYVHLTTPEQGRQFLERAEAEGFTYCDGEKPTAREATEIMAGNPDMTLNFVGFCGRMAYGSGVQTIGNRPLIRIEYGQWDGTDNP